jgi:hypothetical protein
MSSQTITDALIRMGADHPETYLIQAASLLRVANHYWDQRLAAVTPGEQLPAWLATFGVQLAQANMEYSQHIHAHMLYLDGRDDNA